MEPRVLWTTRGLVEAPIDQVATVLFESSLRTPVPSGVVQDYDEKTRTLTRSGTWWYRSVLAVEPHECGAVVTHRLYDISQKGRWMVRGILLQYRLNGTLQAIRDGGLPTRLREIGERLGCRTEILESRR